MTQAKRLVELAERCEAATEGDVSLSYAIWQAVVGPTAPHSAQPDYTESLDAAVALVPEVPDWFCGRAHEKPFAHIDGTEVRYAATPALALCAAALRARAQSPGESRE